MGPRRGVLNKVLYGDASPGGSNPYPLIHKFLPKRYPFHIPRAKLHPFLVHCTSRMKQTNRISYDHHVFQSFWFSCSKGASIYMFCIVISAKIWHPLIRILHFSYFSYHFAADFVTLSFTKTAISPTLQYTVSLKKAPLSGGGSPL